MAYGRFWVERYLPQGWVKFTELRPKNVRLRKLLGNLGGFTFYASFPSSGGAIKACGIAREKLPRGLGPLRVVDGHGKVVWKETGDVPAPKTPQEVQTQVADLPTLNLDRDQLLTALQERVGEEEQKREEAAAKIASSRKAAEDSLASLSGEELLNLVGKYRDWSWDDIVKMVDEAKETGRLKNPETKPGLTETALEKQVRVLTMSTDKTVEVKPTDSIYDLL